MGEIESQGGIDDTSSAAEIRDAFERLGLRMDTHSVGQGMWEAHAVAPAAGDAEGIVGRGASEREAAAAAWRSYVQTTGGIGAS